MASPGRRASCTASRWTLLRSWGRLRISRATRERSFVRACVSRPGVLHRVWQPVEQWHGITADTARAKRPCGVMLHGTTSPTFSAVDGFALNLRHDFAAVQGMEHVGNGLVDWRRVALLSLCVGTSAAPGGMEHECSELECWVVCSLEQRERQQRGWCTASRQPLLQGNAGECEW